MTRREKLEKISALVDKFKDITGYVVPMNILGIDIFKFSELLNIPNDMSMKDFVMNKWGQEAVDTMVELMDYDLL